jgi:hypothetical protein
MRTPEGVHQEVWGLSNLFQKAGVKRRNNRSDEIKLVVELFQLER